MRLRAALAEGALVLDGGLATELEGQGHDLSDALWSARLLRDNPDAIVAAHRAFCDAGADVAITASYQASVEGFARVGVERAAALELMARSVGLARNAGARIVAGSVGPFGAAQADGSEYTGDYGDIAPAALVEFHTPRLDALRSAGADCFAFETIPRLDEAGALIGLLQPGDEAWLSLQCRDAGHLASGERIEAIADVIRGADALIAVGVNCTAPEHALELLTRLRSICALPLVCYPNSGRTWDAVGRRWLDAGVDGFPAELVASWRSAGAELVGGCCGVSPAGIAGVLHAE